LIYVLLLGLFLQCAEKKTAKPEKYLGPSLELDDIELSYGDSARVMVRMRTAKELDLSNTDKVYPKEVRLYFYNDTGQESTTIRSDSGRYSKSLNEYKLMGNILINDKLKNQNMTTTELIWSPDKKVIYTLKPVDLITPSQTLHGMGLRANQDFRQYSLGSSSGLLNLPN
jgi:LPS export ABC transporter protein LptC